MSPIIFTVEGNVGSGKTTMLKSIMNTDPEIVVILEPVDDWMNVRLETGSASLFELYYNDKVKYGFAFQMMALQTRFDNMIKMCKQNDGKIILCERSFLTDMNVFAKLMAIKGFISPIEMLVYNKWYESISELIDLDIRGSIYLRADPATCLTRVNKRNRKGEEGISIEYLTELHDAHEGWLNAKACDASNASPNPSNPSDATISTHSNRTGVRGGKTEAKPPSQRPCSERPCLVMDATKSEVDVASIRAFMTAHTMQ